MDLTVDCQANRRRLQLLINKRAKRARKLPRFAAPIRLPSVDIRFSDCPIEMTDTRLSQDIRRKEPGIRSHSASAWRNRFPVGHTAAALASVEFDCGLPSEINFR